MSDCFKHFSESIMQHLKGWMEKQLSIRGKEILLKSIAQAIPCFCDVGILFAEGDIQRYH